jgi:hypothetical protein
MDIIMDMGIQIEDCIKVYLDRLHPNQNLLILVDSFDFDDEMCGQLCRVSKIDLRPFHGLFAAYKIDEQNIGPTLTLLHDDKWGVGSHVYIWHDNRLIFGRD